MVTERFSAATRPSDTQAPPQNASDFPLTERVRDTGFWSSPYWSVSAIGSICTVLCLPWCAGLGKSFAVVCVAFVVFVVFIVGLSFVVWLCSWWTGLQGGANVLQGPLLLLQHVLVQGELALLSPHQLPHVSTGRQGCQWGMEVQTYGFT